jgi:hypothetical protein
VSKILIGDTRPPSNPEGYGFTGAISLGFDGKGTRQRIKRKGRTKAIVKDKLIKAVADRDAGLKTVEGYTVAQAVQDWLSKRLKDRDKDTITTNRILPEQHVIPLIGATKLTELTADDVDDWLDGLTPRHATRACKVSTRSSSGPSGRPRPATGCCGTWPSWSRRPRASQDGPAKP